MERKIAPVLRVVQPQAFSRNVMDLIVIGNGIAGMTAALEVARLAPYLKIAIATNQGYPTVNKPAFRLYATGQLSANQLLAFPEENEHTRCIAIINEPVKYIEAEQHAIGLSGNRWLGYRSLIVATGCKPVELPLSLPGRELDGVFTLHSLEDYSELRRRLPAVTRAVVLGGGIHAAEMVLSLLQRGIRVCWIMRGAFLSRLLDPAASALALSNLQQPGLRIATDTEIAAILGRSGTVAAVVTNYGERILCDLLLVCIGTTPDITLALRSTVPLRTSNGILVDEYFRTNVPDIYAIGDVASMRHPQKASYEPRRTWSEATLQGHMLAGYLCGYGAATPGLGTPWHATRLGKLCLLTVGDPLTQRDDYTTYIHTRNGYRRIVMKGHRLVGYLYLGSMPPDSLAFKRIIDEGIPIQDVRALLHSHFDARAYATQWQSQHIRRQLA